MKKKIIIFDLDDVLYKDAFWGVLKEFCRIYLNREITKEEVGKEYFYENAIFKDEPEARVAFHKFFLTQNMYNFGKLEKGVIKLLKRLSKTHIVIIYTSAIFETEKDYAASGILFKNKFEALCKMFPFLDPNNFIIGRNKSILHADYMSDDIVSNLDGDIDVKMLYTALHNLHISDKELFEKGIFRVSSMEEIEKVVYGEYSNAEMLELVNKYLEFIPVKGKKTTCSEIQVITKPDEDTMVEVKLDGLVYEVLGIENANMFEKFMTKRLGVKVYLKNTYKNM